MWRAIQKNKTTFFVFAFLATILIYYFWQHRSPFTQNAFIVANYQPVTPLVDGFIDKIYVHDDQIGPFAKMELDSKVVCFREKNFPSLPCQLLAPVAFLPGILGRASSNLQTFLACAGSSLAPPCWCRRKAS